VIEECVHELNSPRVRTNIGDVGVDASREMSLFAQTLNIGFHMSFALYCRTLRIYILQARGDTFRDTPRVHGRKS